MWVMSGSPSRYVRKLQELLPANLSTPSHGRRSVLLSSTVSVARVIMENIAFNGIVVGVNSVTPVLVVPALRRFQFVFLS